MVIKSVGILSVARFASAIYAIFGLIAGFFLSLMALAGAGISEEVSSQASWLGPFFGLGAVLALPVIYYVLGFLGGAIGAWVFNNVAQTVGGLEIELEEGP
jgi:hypothetical protein